MTYLGRKRMSPTRAPRDVWERLTQRLDEFTEREGRHSNAALIRRMRETFFADVDALEKSGTVKIPK